MTRVRAGAMALFACVASLTTVAVVPSAADAAMATVPAAIRVADPATIDDVARQYGLVVTDTIVEHRGVFSITAPDDQRTVDQIKKDARVIWLDIDLGEDVEDDRFHAWPNGQPTPAPSTGDQLDALLDLPAVHAVTTGAGATVAVIDTGAELTHPLLGGQARAGWDLIDDDATVDDVGNGRDDDGDGRVDEAVGHGTHVTGLIARVAPGADIIVYRAVDSDGQGDIARVAEAIAMAVEAGADVINLSLGSDAKVHSRAMNSAISAANRAGVLLIGAAGNSANSAERFPAADKAFIAVTAVNTQVNRVAWFASRGRWVDVAAPGVDVVSALPGGRLARWSGTSMAAPVVAGQAALLLEIDPTANRSDLSKWIRDTASKVKGLDVERGLINMWKSIEVAD